MRTLYDNCIEYFLKEEDSFPGFWSLQKSRTLLKHFSNFIIVRNIVPAQLTRLSPREIMAYLISVKDQAWNDDEELEHASCVLIRFIYYVHHCDSVGGPWKCHEHNANDDYLKGVRS